MTKNRFTPYVLSDTVYLKGFSFFYGGPLFVRIPKSGGAEEVFSHGAWMNDKNYITVMSQSKKCKTLLPIAVGVFWLLL